MLAGKTDPTQKIEQGIHNENTGNAREARADVAAKYK